MKKKSENVLRKVVADLHIPFLQGVLEPYCQVVYLPGSRISRSDLVDADALLIRTRTRCNSDLLDGTAIRFIGSATIGTDHMDTGYCEKNGIAWVNAPGCNANSVMQYMAAVISLLTGKNLFNPGSMTLGIIGAGNVGSRVEKLAKVLGIRVLVNDPPRERAEGPEGFTSLRDLVHGSDLISLHVPLTPHGRDKTWHLVDKDFLSAMKSHAILVNTSRGEVVSSRDLEHALKTRIIRGAVLDVWENEPIIDTNLLNQVLLATPHIAGYSVEGKANGTSMIIRDLSRAFRLGLDNWQPQNLPLPSQPDCICPDPHRNDLDILMNCILHTYPLEKDDERLRSTPAEFEDQRAAYPIRREFTAYAVKCPGSGTQLKSALQKLGFQVYT